MRQLLLALCLSIACPVPARAGGLSADGTAIYLDFSRTIPGLRLRAGLKAMSTSFGSALEFAEPLQYAEH